jgi:hypothetical protein
VYSAVFFEMYFFDLNWPQSCGPEDDIDFSEHLFHLAIVNHSAMSEARLSG